MLKNLIVLAPDSFKGTLSARDAASAMSKGVESALKKLNKHKEFTVISLPIADGGEGMADAIGDSICADTIKCTTYDPLMRPINASYRMHQATAYIDLASASGLTLLNEKERNPLHTSTFGTGQLIKDAITRNAKKIVIGLGGSATNDAALGALQTLGLKIYDKHGILFNDPIRGCDLSKIGSFDTSILKRNTTGITFLTACDVNTVFSGNQGAAHIFAPQKGADPRSVELLDSGLKNVENIIRNSGFTDISATPGGGAAGGAGGGLNAFLDAHPTEGIELVLDAIDFDSYLPNAKIILTGEGKADRQTLMGKAPQGVLRHASRSNIPVILFAGKISDKKQLLEGGFCNAYCINPPDMPVHLALEPTQAFTNLTQSVEKEILLNLFTNFAQ